jgi:hypothetical protein
MTNARSNPFSNQEWIHNPIIIRDFNGVENAPAEMMANIGVFQGRMNMVNYTLFDSNQYMHFDNGLIWEWSGETVLV